MTRVNKADICKWCEHLSECDWWVVCRTGGGDCGICDRYAEEFGVDIKRWCKGDCAMKRARDKGVFQ